MKKILMILLTLIASTCITFAGGIENIGQNAGGWILDQLWWVALAIIAFIAVKFLLRKAWAQLIIFLVIAGLVLFIITSPGNLKTIGETIFSIVTGN